MFELLATYLREKAGLTEAEIQRVEAFTVAKKLRKRQYLLQEGDTCTYNCFIAKGLLRMYRLGKNGTEHILRFGIENWWMADYESYNTGNPSVRNIDALEDSELLLIKKEHFDALISEIPGFQNFIKQLEYKSFDVSQNRILSNISDTAEERYIRFVQTYPEFNRRIPLHMIASYLGTSRETLSRIRQKRNEPEK
ncbi:Crp/Fnr family transcriptional regulator [Dyadobacter sp. LJ53]|uniref:Crp/Fnr family transcriptional regulator n=1 Tax=Dyadobacter chenwenxiniae TaxID=2906456 RepID=UPI001F2BD093|nr:Crp/Fnr family transcriptional regulator [Dyadobacter chenwenxiniae]MCF0050440.1 Crp/Fnr family transcriptional regulator [Dyadobacter chenwenxiniae]